MEQKEIDNKVDPKELVILFLKNFWVISLSAILVAVATFLISTYVLTPMYQSTTKIYVMNRQDTSSSITYSDLEIGTQLTNDYMILVTSRPVTEKVISDLQLNISHSALIKMISVSNPTNTRLLNITVKYPDPNMAKQIADAVREASAIHISNVMDIGKVNVVEEGNIADTPSSPNVLYNALIGGFLGGIVCVVVVFFIYRLDDRIKTPEDIEKYLELSVLSTIPIQKNLKSYDSKQKHIQKKQAKVKKSKTKAIPNI